MTHCAVTIATYGPVKCTTSHCVLNIYNPLSIWLRFLQCCMLDTNDNNIYKLESVSARAAL